jgi:hypothetical protein
MLRLESLAVNPELDKEGQEVPSVAFEGVFFKVRPIDYPPFQMELARQGYELKKKHGDTTPTAEYQKLRTSLLAKHILVGWRGLDVEYTPEAAQNYLANPSFRRLVDDIETCAGKLLMTNLQYVDETVKN